VGFGKQANWDGPGGIQRVRRFVTIDMIEATGTRPAPAYPRPHCSRAGCANLALATCAYVDRRGAECGTAWCWDHHRVLDGHAYCARHVHTLEGLEHDDLSGGPLPDVRNRAPSLVGWMAASLDSRITALLETRLAPGSAEHVSGSAVRLIRSADGLRRWERSWRIADHTGVHMTVSIEIEEPRDPEVHVRVDREVVARGIPPWIARRLRGLQLAPDADAREREAFFSAVFGRIEHEVLRERPGVLSPSSSMTAAS
jgi:hypothetical protein